MTNATKETNRLGIPSKEDILEIVRKEGKLRLSPEYIKECDDVAQIPNGWIDVSINHQKRLIKEAGFTGIGAKMALVMLRAAQYSYPDEPDVQELVYVKNNKANVGTFEAGDHLREVQLFDITGQKEVSLFSLLDDTKPNIIFGASHT